jgi:hypothetical protein
LWTICFKTYICTLNKPIKQPSWASEAERCDYTTSGFASIITYILSAVNIDDKSPCTPESCTSQDRLSLNLADGKVKPLQEVITKAWVRNRRMGWYMCSGRQVRRLQTIIQFAEQPLNGTETYSTMQ